ncbi:MAG TPA: diacylglycerol kinase family protein [Acidimicrobiia bacterium]|nr:diacylglycerol kinase family protein [Acidimicrobiia bacterium]
MPRLLLVANPSSSQFTGGSHRTVVRILSRAFSVETSWPQSPDHARRLAAEAATDGVEVVAAMGGDGVAHHVGQGLAGTSTALGLIPTGTTNVYARLVGVPEKPVPAARLLAGVSRVRTYPLLTVEGEQEGAPIHRHALFAAGFGFDADVVAAAESEPYRKYRFGGLHYARTAINTMLSAYRRQLPTAKARVNGEGVEALAVLVQFHPVYTYFGRLQLKLGDTPSESMTVLTVDSLPARRLLRIGATLLTGADLDKIPGFRVWREVDDLQIDATPAIAGQADGELTGSWNQARVTLWTDAVRVVVPAGG